MAFRPHLFQASYRYEFLLVFKLEHALYLSVYTLRKSLQTTSTLSATSKQCFELTSSVISTASKQCFEQPAASFLVYSLIFIEYSFCSFTESYLSSIQAQVVLSYKLDKLTVIVPSDYKTSSSLTLEFNVVPQ